MTQTDIATCLVELERLWRALPASDLTATSYPNEAMSSWAQANSVAHDQHNPWYARDYRRLRLRLLQEHPTHG